MLTRRRFLSTAAQTTGAALLATLLGPDAMAAAQEHAASRSFQGTLSIFDFGAFSGYPRLMKDVIDAYQSLHPGVKIQLVSAPSGIDFTTYTITQLTAGTAPDIVSPAVAMEPWADLSRNWWLELTEWVNSPNPYDAQRRSYRARMQPVYLEQLQLDNRFWSMAIAGQDAMVYYNKHLFTKAGVTTAPKTWGEFMHVQERLHNAGIIPFGMDANDITYGDPWPSLPAIIESMTMPETLRKLHQGSGIVTVDELVKGIENGIFNAHSAEYQETWRLLKDWSGYWQSGFAGGSTATGSAGSPGWNLFLKGKAAMGWAGSYAVYNIETTVPKAHAFAWDVFPFPQVTPASSHYATPGHKNIGVWGAWGAIPWAITYVAQKRGHTDLAKDFLFFLSAPRQAALVDQVEVYIPLFKGLPIKGTNSLETGKLKEFSTVMSQPCALSTAETALGSAVQIQRTKLLQSYLTGQIPLDSAMDQMQSALTLAARQAQRWLRVAQH